MQFHLVVHLQFQFQLPIPGTYFFAGRIPSDFEIMLYFCGLFSSRNESNSRRPSGGYVNPLSSSGAGLFSQIKGGAGSLFKNLKDTSSKVVQSVQSYVFCRSFQTAPFSELNKDRSDTLALKRV